MPIVELVGTNSTLEAMHLLQMSLCTTEQSTVPNKLDCVCNHVALWLFGSFDEVVFSLSLSCYALYTTVQFHLLTLILLYVSNIGPFSPVTLPRGVALSSIILKKNDRLRTCPKKIMRSRIHRRTPVVKTRGLLTMVQYT